MLVTGAGKLRNSGRQLFCLVRVSTSGYLLKMPADSMFVLVPWQIINVSTSNFRVSAFNQFQIGFYPLIVLESTVL